MSATPHNLLLPQALLDLIDSGFWPLTQQQSNAQHSHCLIARDKIQSFAPDEEYIFFYRPPFSTEAEWIKRNPFLTAPMWANHEIDPALTLIIGDFGLGSDAPIALDYRKDLNEPSIIRLQWNLEADNHWVEIAPSFAEFVAMLFD